MRPTLRSVRRRVADLFRGSARPRKHAASHRTVAGAPPPETARPYPGDATRLPDTTYRPRRDGDPDPGEVVWVWVPYEEDHHRGKDRPVLVIGRERLGGRDWLIGLSLTSRDHDRDAEQERRAGREWVDIGGGPWDSRGRPSEVRVNRLLRLDPASIRREGAVLDERRYATVVEAAARFVGGS